MSGSAGDNVNVAKVEVRLDSGPYRTAAGTAAWTIALDTTTSTNGTHLIFARATDGAGNVTVANVSVSIANPVPDSSPPTVTITRPTFGDIVAGTVAVTGNASDNLTLAKVEVSVDGEPYRATQGTSSWTFSLDTTLYSDGMHAVAAKATDAAGNVSSTTESVTVQNPTGPAAEPLVVAPPIDGATIGGFAFKDLNRDALYETGEQPLVGQHIYLFSSAGTYLRNTYSDATGWFQFNALPDGAYRVEYAPASWWDIRADWVPDTTPSFTPAQQVSLPGPNRADFGWRTIVRSSQASSPVTAYNGPNGLRVESFDDVISAKQVYDRLVSGTLVGPEASDITIRFDLTQTGTTSTMTTQTNGVYTNYSATSNVTYLSWLDGDNELFHEYGHAWSLYYAYMVRQDPSLTGYLAARGLLGDSRLGTSYAWNPNEMISEDYRQLFGTPTAASVAQMNREIPPAKDVPGLATFLATTFTGSPGQ